MPPEIPYPALTRRYVDLKDLSSADRLKQAKQTTASDLATEFLDAARAFSSFTAEELTEDGEFFPKSRTDEGKSAKADARTFGWTMKLQKMDSIPVAGGGDLEFRYVEREIIPTRTKPQLKVAGGGKHVRVDLLLANAADGRPIVGELKIASDKDPYTGLVQALAGAAQLVSEAQRVRLCKLKRAPGPGVPLASIESDPRVDVYVLIGNFPQRGRDRFKQLDRAVELADQLESDRALGALLGRIRVVAVKRDEQGVLTATTELPKAPPAR